MPLVLPDAADAESPLKPAELQVLRSQYEKEGEYVSVQTKFNFAWGLIKSSARADQQTGVQLLSEIFRTSPERRRECLYYLALGNYKLGNYADARRYNDSLLDLEPANLQASSLRSLIDDKVAREGMMGAAIVGGIAIAAGVVEPGDDPRSNDSNGGADTPPMPDAPRIPHQHPSDPYSNLHRPWLEAPDPDEGDIEQHVTQHMSPGGSVRFTRVTFRSRTPRGGHHDFQPDAPVMDSFQRMIQDFMGPGVGRNRGPDSSPRSSPRNSRSATPLGGGRQGPGGPFLQDRDGGPSIPGFGFPSGPTPNRDPPQPGVRYTSFSTSRLHPRDANNPQPRAEPVADLATMMQMIMQNVHNAQAHAPPPGPEGGRGVPAGTNPLFGLFSSIFNPEMATQGDAVYTQEALDSIISQLMEQNTSSNAPGPASPEAIASLPKKKVDKSMLSDDAKAECSVCMDDVPVGQEVVSLPCSHWFHEQCATAWLKEHDTCPICRKGITSSPSSGNGTTNARRRDDNVNDTGSPRRSPPQNGWANGPPPGFVFGPYGLQPNVEHQRPDVSRRHRSRSSASDSRPRSRGGSGEGGGGITDR
ncbi:MAG: mitochondrial membrane protein, partial [Piccolia ochrophora]